jgi:hypothetical protein
VPVDVNDPGAQTFGEVEGVFEAAGEHGRHEAQAAPIQQGPRIKGLWSRSARAEQITASVSSVMLGPSCSQEPVGMIARRTVFSADRTSGQDMRVSKKVGIVVMMHPLARVVWCPWFGCTRPSGRWVDGDYEGSVGRGLACSGRLTAIISHIST